VPQLKGLARDLAVCALDLAGFADVYRAEGRLVLRALHPSCRTPPSSSRTWSGIQRRAAGSKDSLRRGLAQPVGPPHQQDLRLSCA